MATEAGLGNATQIAHLGEDVKILGAVTPPMFQNSLFLFDTIDELHAALAQTPNGAPYLYSRVGNPTVDVVEQKIAHLEGAEACKVTSSGMAAISLAIMSCVKAGSHVITLDTVYKPVRVMLDDILQKFGVTYTLVDGRCTDEILDAIRPETSLIYLESPSSIMFRLQDVETITKVAREKGISTIFDNTYASPLYCQPLKLGVDIVCHSATKYLNGHSDLTAGVLCTTHERMAKIINGEIATFGSLINPFGAWLLLRGLRTLPLRLKQHEQTANTVAAWLEYQPEVDKVHHLGLPSFPQRDLVAKMFSGTGGLFSFETKNQDGEKVKAFCDRLRLFGRGVSWGGFESLVITFPVTCSGGYENRWVIRLFCGLEDAEDLIADLKQAFQVFHESTT